MRIFSPTSASHWYDQNGEPVHSVPMKSKPGEMRDTNVADARKMGLLPSVTNIISIIDKPELTAWKQTQAVLAALTLPRNPLEGDDDFAIRVAKDSKEQVTVAAQRGQRIHAAIEEFLLFGSATPDQSVVDLFEPFKDWSQANIEDVIAVEQTLVGDGYAGKCDLLAVIRGHGPLVIDFKTRKPFKGAFANYVSDDLQLSAYKQALAAPWRDRPFGRASVYINSEEPAEPHIHIWPAEQYEDSASAFLAAFEIWTYIKKYDPRQPQP